MFLIKLISGNSRKVETESVNQEKAVISEEHLIHMNPDSELESREENTRSLTDGKVRFGISESFEMSNNDYANVVKLVNVVLAENPENSFPEAGFKGYLIPKNACSISIATEHFVCGENAFSFKLSSEKAEELKIDEKESRILYARRSENFSKTYLEIDGVRTLAGVYISFLPPTWDPKFGLERELNVFWYFWHERRKLLEPFPEGAECPNGSPFRGAWCNRHKRRVLVRSCGEHVWFLYKNNSFWYEPCSHCKLMLNLPEYRKSLKKSFELMDAIEARRQERMTLAKPEEGKDFEVDDDQEDDDLVIVEMNGIDYEDDNSEAEIEHLIKSV